MGVYKHKIVGPSHFEIFQPSRAFIDVNLRDKVWRVLVSTIKPPKKTETDSVSKYSFYSARCECDGDLWTRQWVCKQKLRGIS